MGDVIGSAEIEIRATKKKLATDLAAIQNDIKRAVANAAAAYQNAWGKASDSAAVAVERNSRRMIKDIKRVEREVKVSAGAIGKALSSTAGKLGIGVSAVGAVALLDSYTRFSNALRVAGVEGSAFAEVQERLFSAANRNGVEAESLGVLYGRLAQAQRELGASQSDLLRFTDGVSAAIRVQGASAAESRGALVQLTQALGGEIVRAEEFNSINEGARPILQAVATGIDRFGGSVSALRREVVEGHVTSQEFFQGFLRGSADLEAKAAKAPLTIAAAFQVLQNHLVRYIGEADQANGASAALTFAIQKLGENIPLIANALAVIAVILAGRYAAAVGLATAAGALQTAELITRTAAIYGVSRAAATGAVAMRGLSASMAFFGGPIGLAITALTLTVFGLTTAITRAAHASAEYQHASDAASTSATAYAKAADAASIATGKGRAAALEAAKASRAQAVADRDAAAAKLQMARATLAAIQARNAEILQGPMDPEAGAGQLVYQGRQEAKAKANFDAVNSAVASATAAIASADKVIKAAVTPAGGSATSAGKKGRAPTGPTAAELAERREALRLQNELAIAEAAGDEAKIKALQAEIELRRLIEDFKSTGLSQGDAESAALWQQLQLVKARGEAEANIVKAREIDQNPDGFVSSADRMAEATGGLVAQSEESKAAFRDMFTSGLMAALDGSRGGVAEWMRQGAERGLEQALNNLADLIFELFSQSMPSSGGGGGGFWASAASAVGSLFGFGGARAYGGPVTAGKSYLVGEHGPEILRAPMNGMIVPNGGIAGAANGGSGSSVNVSLAVTPSPYFDVRVTEIARPIAATATFEGVKHMENKQARAQRAAGFGVGRR